jgi:cytochrome c5
MYYILVYYINKTVNPLHITASNCKLPDYFYKLYKTENNMKKLALILTLALFIVSCGKKEETQTTTPQDQQQVQQQTQQQTQSTDQTKQEEKKDEMTKNDEKKKEDEMKKDDDKKKEDEKTKTEIKDESISKTDEKTGVDTKKDTKTNDFAAIFSKRCAKCHGKDLKGREDGGPDLTRSETQNKSDSKLFNIISNGVKADNEEDEDMPAFKNKLSEEEIDAAVKYIKSR